MGFFEKLAENKSIILFILILDIIGVFFSAYTYRYDILINISIGDFFIIPFFMVSFWLFFLSALCCFYLYKSRKLPSFLGGLSFIYCFVYVFCKRCNSLSCLEYFCTWICWLTIFDFY